VPEVLADAGRARYNWVTPGEGGSL